VLIERLGSPDVLAGKPPDHMLLLMPGLSDNVNVWSRLVPLISHKDFEIWRTGSFADSLRSDGSSWTVEDFAKTVAEDIAAVRPRQITLVSHSAGVVAALELATRSPGLIHKVIAVNGGLIAPLELFAQPARAFTRRTRTSLRVVQLLIMISVRVPMTAKKLIIESVRLGDALLRGFVAPAHRRDSDIKRILLTDDAKPRIVRALFHNRRYLTRFEDNARAVTQEIILAAGAWDGLATVTESRELCRYFSSAMVVEFSDCGHVIPLENPTRLARLINGTCSDADSVLVDRKGQSQ